jgi:predicted dehydrogenase
MTDRAEDMTSDAVGVGVIGLSAHGGWGAAAHVPALTAAGGFELRGLVGSSPAAAEAASRVYGVPAHTSAAELASADGVDLVVVAVKTPTHRELVLPVLAQDRAVFCEWPLAIDAAEAEVLVEAAGTTPTFVGLQGRSAPAFRWLAHLVADGYVGEVLSVTVLSSATEWGSPVGERHRYTLDRSQGATMLTIGFGAAIDPVLMAVGELTDVVATTATRRPLVPLQGTGRMIPMTAEDQIAISGLLPNGGVLSAHQRGGLLSGPAFSVVVDGTEGTIEVTAANHPHVAPATVRGSRGRHPLAPLAPPPGSDAFPELAGTHLHSLAHAYSRIREQLRGGREVVPGFDAALTRHRLLDAVQTSAATGRRIDLDAEA